MEPKMSGSQSLFSLRYGRVALSLSFIEKDRRSLVALIVALQFASSTALGYDPTIEWIRQVEYSGSCGTKASQGWRYMQGFN